MSLSNYQVGDILHFINGKGQPRFVIVLDPDCWRWLDEENNVPQWQSGFSVHVERFHPKVVGNIDNFISSIKERLK